MTDDADSDLDAELLDRLTEAFGPADRQPPAEGIAAVRRLVDAERARVGAGGPDQPTPITSARTAGVRRMGSSRRDLLLGGAAASAGVALGIAGVLATRDDPSDGSLPGGPPTEDIELAGAPPGVTATGALINHTWGVELMFDVSGLPAGRDYGVSYRSRSGDELGVGGFRSVADVTMSCRFTGAILRDEAAAIEVKDLSTDEILLLSDLT